MLFSLGSLIFLNSRISASLSPDCVFNRNRLQRSRCVETPPMCRSESSRRIFSSGWRSELTDDVISSHRSPKSFCATSLSEYLLLFISSQRHLQSSKWRQRGFTDSGKSSAFCSDVTPTCVQEAAVPAAACRRPRAVPGGGAAAETSSLQSEISQQRRRQLWGHRLLPGKKTKNTPQNCWFPLCPIGGTLKLVQNEQNCKFHDVHPGFDRRAQDNRYNSIFYIFVVLFQ